MRREKSDAVPAAELLAYMYDRSLESFVPHSPANPLGLYPYRGRSLQARANLGQANPLWINSNGFNSGPSAPILTATTCSFSTDMASAEWAGE